MKKSFLLTIFASAGLLAPAQDAPPASPAPQQRVDPRQAQITAIRTQITKEEAAKAKVPKNVTKQGHINAQNEKIRLLQLELGKLGVAGASLERR